MQGGGEDGVGPVCGKGGLEGGFEGGVEGRREAGSRREVGPLGEE